MRILILSDVHANLGALEAALTSAGGRWEQAVCLGDLVGYGPDPNEVVMRLREIGAITIRGNHDKVCCDLEEPDGFNPTARAAALWTRDRLSPDVRAYLRELPEGPMEFQGVTLVHGALHDEDEYVFTPVQALDGLLDARHPVTFFGHTHVQGGFVLRANQVEGLTIRVQPQAHEFPLPIEPGVSYLLNPGSIGQPRDGDPRAGFAVADLPAGKVEFWRVSYDVGAVQARMAAAGLPEPLIVRLAIGR